MNISLVNKNYNEEFVNRSKNGSEKMDHPDIKYVERYGYTRQELPYRRPIGVCMFCGSDIVSDSDGYVKSFDGLFCDIECCHSYYEIETEEY